jgi:hypothetical protein
MELYDVNKKYIEIIILKKPKVDSYDVSQLLHLERMLNKKDYEGLSKYTYFDDTIKGYEPSLDMNKLRNGLKRMTDSVLSSTTKGGVDEYDVEDDMFVHVDGPSVDGGAFKAVIPIEEEEKEQSSSTQDVEGGLEEIVTLSITPDDDSVEEDVEWFVSGGSENDSFKYKDRIIFFETLTEVSPEDLKEIFGVEDEKGLDNLIKISDEEFAGYVSSTYATTVAPKPYKKIEEPADMRDKIKYILDKEAFLLNV